MTSKHLLGSTLIGIALLFSCDKVSENVESELSQNQAEELHTVYVELTGNTGNDEFRLAELVDKTTGLSHGVEMDDTKDLNIRVAVRRGTGSPVYQTLRFSKVKGSKRVYYKGNMVLPKDGSGAYQMAAIVLGEVGGRTFANTPGDKSIVRFDQSARLTGIVDKNGVGANRGVVIYSIPYLVDWRPMQVSADGKRALPLDLHFHPNGTLLRFQILNTTQQPHTVKAIKISTNAFFRTWDYDLSKSLNAGNLMFGQTANVNKWEQEYPFSQITLQPNAKSPWYYLWVMPNKNTNGLRTDIQVKTSGNEFIPAFGTTNGLKLGAIGVTLSMRGSSFSGDFEGTQNQGSLVETF